MTARRHTPSPREVGARKRLDARSAQHDKGTTRWAQVAASAERARPQRATPLASAATWSRPRCLQAAGRAAGLLRPGMAAPVRKPTHAGSWYTADGARQGQQRQAARASVTEAPLCVCAARALSQQLDGFLRAATVDSARVRALIVPHAGYSYSGATAAFGYKAVDPSAMCVLRRAAGGLVSAG